MKNQKVLVTGANGFIGAHLARRLVQENAQVAVSVRESSDVWRLDEIKADIDIHKVDLRDFSAVENCIKQTKPDFIFHVGAYGVDSRQKEYLTAANTNIIGTMNMINATKSTGCKKFINVGTCMEYGDKQEIIREDAHLEPDSIYGSTKASATIIAHQIAAEHHIDIVTLRPFGIFGEKEGTHKFFPYIILSILEGKEVHLTPCEQYRDYCYIENIMDGFILAAQNESVKNEIFNIGSGEVRKLKVYVDMIYKEMGISQRPQYGALAYRKNEVWKQQPDTSKIRNALAWQPKVDLTEGIARTVRWYQANKNKFIGTGR
ncbi:NAD-dependent epimerase/dehydratase family protein [Heliophilum fasciatum]|uniref:Nucleoside-diphosphate-sugar epimerase n=1 Tax=Heliophilum fasciatum TaxID=35700 RepID=A0A4R2RE35_9FIRM|nr:SDR family NAD(P)-dependent oxidoreductase [Heliophilum fasciatum]MCW2279263.1 nucleoside-diphosphate-sugar epimerase [Heliophilum fasciatum]TCP60489.1 nucleoside-diphosphate-sugar epimerase [Heliophilum fasciatum]